MVRTCSDCGHDEFRISKDTNHRTTAILVCTACEATDVVTLKG